MTIAGACGGSTTAAAEKVGGPAHTPDVGLPVSSWMNTSADSRAPGGRWQRSRRILRRRRSTKAVLPSSRPAAAVPLFIHDDTGRPTIGV